MANGVLIVGEVAGNGSLRPVSLELATAGRALADAAGGPLVALLMGNGASAQAGSVAAAGVDRVLVVEDDRFGNANAEAAASAVAAAITAAAASIVLMPGTTAGRDYAPKLAARLGAPLAADCIALAVEDGNLRATRTVLGGRVQTVVGLQGPVQLATVRGGSFARAEATAAAAPVEPLDVAFGPGDFRVAVVETAAKGGGATNLDAAEVVVAGGRGLKEPSNFKLVEDLAAALGGAVGATRAVVDAGWRPHEEQIGQTGRVVSPKLYLAAGVSGAVQHNVGMQGSGTIVAINRDPDAPIFKLAQFGIVGDLFEILPALTAEVQRVRG